jgi:hypothetical protein
MCRKTQVSKNLESPPDEGERVRRSSIPRADASPLPVLPAAPLLDLLSWRGSSKNRYNATQDKKIGPIRRPAH